MSDFERRLIPVPLPKGCVLMLTPEEYQAGIRRGKAIQRARRARERTENRREHGGPSK